MDVQAPETNVKPSAAAPRRKTGLREPVGMTFLASGVLAVCAMSGLVSWPAAGILGGVAGVSTFSRHVIFGRRALFSAQAEEAERQAKRLRRFSMVLNSLPQPVLLLDPDDRIELANAAAEHIFGSLVEGEPVSSVIRAPAALGTLREARYEKASREAEFSITAPKTLSALFYAAPLSGEASDTGEMIVMVRDRTQQRQLERMRTDFIANASHELRTPLASIDGFIETLQGHAKDDPEARERFLRIMKAQTERMLRLVKDLVSLSALELNERRLPQDEIDLCEVAATVREMLGPVAAKEGGEVVPGPRDCSARIVGDRDQLIQVIQNLTDNALKYGGTGGDGPVRVHISVNRGGEPAFPGADSSGDTAERVAVRVGCKPEDLHYIRVRDEGEGIDPNDLPRLTERFYRIDVERSRTKGGTGLGLAIVKHIVGRHRGGILIESAPGRGAAFTCYFPPKESLAIFEG